MIFEKISDTKLKVTFYASELNSRRLSDFKTNPSSPEIKAFLITLVKYAALKTGFKCGTTVAVQSVQKSDRLVFFITRLAVTAQKAHPKPHSGGFALFVFSSQREFANFLCTVKNEDFSEAELYTMLGKYYFKAAQNSRLFNNALEFSSPVASSAFLAHIKKSAYLICRGNEFLNLF